MPTLQLMRKMNDRPPPGKTITVYMKDGTELSCTTCRVFTDDSNGIVIYGPDRFAIDENKASGWMPFLKRPKTKCKSGATYLKEKGKNERG